MTIFQVIGCRVGHFGVIYLLRSADFPRVIIQPQLCHLMFNIFVCKKFNNSGFSSCYIENYNIEFQCGRHQFRK